MLANLAVTRIRVIMNIRFCQMMRVCGLAVAILMAVTGAVFAQFSITMADVPITENFNSLPRSGISSWSSNETLTGVYAGGDSQITTGYRDGSIEKTSFGINFTNPASDRALGMSLLGNINSDTVWYGFRFVNNSRVTLHSVEIGYFVERYFGWADESTRFTEGFQVYTAENPSTTGNPSGPEWVRRTSLEFHPGPGPVPNSTGPATLSSGVYFFDGNNVDYRTERNATLAISGGLASGAEYWIMFGNSVAGVLDGKTISDGVAIDDLTVTFSTAVVPEPASVAAAFGLLALVGAAVRRWRAGIKN